MDEKILRAVYDKYAPEGKLNPTGLYELIKKLGHLSAHESPNSPSQRTLEILKNISMTNVLSAYAFIDRDGDGNISYEEFKKWWIAEDRYQIFSGQKSALLQKAYTLYKKYDKGKGLSPQEFTKLLNNLDVDYEGTGRESFNALDSNSDGHISFREFIDWLQWL